jgi:hypothetical protein
LNLSALIQNFWNNNSDSDNNQSSKIQLINLDPNPEAIIMAIKANILNP